MAENAVKVADRLVIADTCDVTLESLADGKVIMSAEAQLASISQTVDEQEIRGGIGAGLIGSISSQKTIEATFRDALFSLDYVSIASGTGLEEAEADFLVQTKGKVEGETITISDKETTKGIVTTADNLQMQVDIEGGVLSVDKETVAPGAEDGDEVSVAIIKTAKGTGVKIRADKFPEKYRLTYRTIAYDPVTMEHVNDIIIQFYEVKAAGDFDLGFEMSTPIAPELSFQVTKPVGCQELGQILAVEPNTSEVDC